MKNNVIRGNMPPVIRVFLSSTFADMENERTYFNDYLVPRLNRICAERGVSFFSVDLRWGITEEEQVGGQVLPICLGEIDKCRPYFIGIIGNRYGSVMEEVPAQIGDSIPWLFGKEGHSITELEMLYAVLDIEEENRAKNCAFYMRSEELSDEWYGNSTPDGRLIALKDRINSDESVPSTEYRSLEEFGEKVMKDILEWLDREFPIPEKISEVRRAWYDRELLRNYVLTPALHAFLDSYCRESDLPLIFYGDGQRGKTTLLSAWEPKDGEKILINCGSDDAFLYWPSIAREIMKGISNIASEMGLENIMFGSSIMFSMLRAMRGSDDGTKEPKRLNTDFFFATDAERERFRAGFLSWLAELPIDKKIYIVINDLNLLEDETGRLLSWLPSSVCGNLRFICSTNDDEMVNNAETLGWNCKEMPLFEKEYAQKVIDDYLHAYGKGLSSVQMSTLLGASVTAYPGQLRFVADFLISYGRFHNLDKLINDISTLTDTAEIYRYVYDYLLSEHDERIEKIVRTVFGLLRCADMSLSEHECYSLTESLTEVSAIDWARARSIFEQFGLIKGDYWNIREEGIIEFADSLLSESELDTVNELLGDYMLDKLNSEEGDTESLSVRRESTAYAKSVLHHYRNCRNWQKLSSALCEHRVLFFLSKLDRHELRVAWISVFLNSDTDIPKALFGIIDKYKDQDDGGRAIAMCVANIIADMGWRAQLKKARELMGTDRISGDLVSDYSTLTNSFFEVYNKVDEMRSNGQIRPAYQELCRVLAAEKEFLPMEMCTLLSLKGSFERTLKLNNESLRTANEYYNIAVRNGFIIEIRKALSLRCDALYGQSEYAKAEETAERISRLALREGDLSEYLNAQTTIAMCTNRSSISRAAEAIALMDKIRTYWMKLGSIRNASSILVNRCNALHISGDTRAALEVATTFYEEIADDDEYKNISVPLLGNMGLYAMELGEYKLAEEYLLKAIEEAEKHALESAQIKASVSLIAIYEKTDRFMKAVELCRKIMEMYWERREYSSLIDTLKKAMKLLHTNRYSPMAEELKDRWEKRFSEIEGGEQLFKQQIYGDVTDTRNVDKLKEKIAIAKSEGDFKKAADIYRDLALEFASDEFTSRFDYLLTAALTYREYGYESECSECLEVALCLLFDDGVLRDKERYEKLLGLIRDPATHRIGELWDKLGSYEEKAEEKSGNESLLDKYLSRFEDKPKTEKFDELLDELLVLRTENERMVVRCAADLSYKLVHRLSAQRLLDLTRMFSESGSEDLQLSFENAMLRDAEADNADLIRDYLSPTAEKTLAFYEKCIEFLDALDANNTATLAGNIAIIFRRRKDREKTIYYHTKSMEHYKRLGLIKDYLIEMMNVATATNEVLGDYEKALDILRQGLAEALENDQGHMGAAIAGNIASILTARNVPDCEDEIMRCFAIEEGFFRDSGSVRDLAISLINQMVYYSRTRPAAEWTHKLAEAGEIVRRHRFREFEQVLSRLEWFAKQGPAPTVSISTEEAEEYIKGILAANGLYVLDSITPENGKYHAVCLPAEKQKTHLVNIHIFLEPSDPDQLHVIFLCQPAIFHSEAATLVKMYVDWWNTYENYILTFHEDGPVLQANCLIRASDRDALVLRFERYMRMWEADVVNLLMLAIGFDDLSLCQGSKLKVANEGQ